MSPARPQSRCAQVVYCCRNKSCSKKANVFSKDNLGSVEISVLTIPLSFDKIIGKFSNLTMVVELYIYGSNFAYGLRVGFSQSLYYYFLFNTLGFASGVTLGLENFDSFSIIAL